MPNTFTQSLNGMGEAYKVVYSLAIELKEHEVPKIGNEIRVCRFQHHGMLDRIEDHDNDNDCLIGPAIGFPE